MKIRWTRQSVRLRISPSEMDRLMAGGEITESLPLPGDRDDAGWVVTLAPADRTRLEKEGDRLCLSLSLPDRTRLAAPETEGVYFETVARSQVIRYYVEKDFPCAHPGAPEACEPAGETFPPPPGFKERHGSPGK